MSFKVQFTLFFKQIMIVKKCDLVFYFILQALILRISVDKFSIIGSVFLVVGNLVLIAHKIITAKLNAKKKKEKKQPA